MTADAAKNSPGQSGIGSTLPEVEIDVADIIVCVDCGGTCHRLTPDPEDGFIDGDIVAYRCEDCLDRWDLIVEDGPQGLE